MLIYKITNRINGKIYIGLDSSSNEHRWYYHRWAYNKPHVLDYNKVLYRAFRKHGLHNFTYEIIDYCESRKELLAAEQLWIKECRSYLPDHGYNRTMGGDSSYADIADPERLRTIYQKISHRTGNSRYFEVICPIGISSMVYNLSAFCRTSGLNHLLMRDVARGRLSNHNGWSCYRLDDQKQRIIPAHKRNPPHLRERHSKTAYWLVTDPHGSEQIIYDLKNFCSTNNLRYRCALRVASGERTHHKKWKIKKYETVQ